MRKRICALAAIMIAASAWQPTLLADDQQDDAIPYGLDQRVPFTNQRFSGRPDPPPPFRLALAYPKLKLPRVIDYVVEPNTDYFLAARTINHWTGPSEIVRVFDDPDSCDFRVVLESPMLVYGLALHPNYSHNGYLYIFGNEQTESGRVNRILRYTMGRALQAGCDPDSRHVILEFDSSGHDGGGIAFGPDGMLYLSTGDGSGGSDQDNKGQALDQICAKVLRIDVDRPSGELPYSIPKDNPFVDMAGARPEVWAYGFRNPWRLTFDKGSGQLWVGNNGQDLWESAYLVEAGANYGWPIVEGSHAFHPHRERGPTPIVPPTVEHPHSEARSLTGGVVYQGERLEMLRGAYVYGDFSTGTIWAVRHDGTEPTWHDNIADTSAGISGFAVGRDDELLVLDYEGGDIHYLEPTPPVDSPADFPRTLSQTELFESVADHRLASAMIPYSINAPQWADNAQTVRYLGLPESTKIGFTRRRAWKMPEGTVLLKTFFLEMEPGVQASRRPVETQVLTRQQNEWIGYTYRWLEDASDAVLVGREGETVMLELGKAPGSGKPTQQTWRFASRDECTACHNRAVDYALGMTTAQMNRVHDYGVVADNQIRTLNHLGLFRTPPLRSPAEYPQLASPFDEQEAPAHRAKSYLHANCHHCHVREGGGNARIELEYQPPAPNAAAEDSSATGANNDTRGRNRRRRSNQRDGSRLIGAAPDHGGFGLTKAQIIHPGMPESSVLFYRMAKRGRGRMPYAGTQVVDAAGIHLIYDWIRELPVKPPQTTAINELRAQMRSNIDGFLSATDASQHAAFRERLVSSTSNAVSTMRAIDQGEFTAAQQAEIIQTAVQHPLESVRDVFERYVPPSEREPRLGTEFEADQVLDIVGDAARGYAIFNADGVLCKSCHTVQGRGGRIGPDLSAIGKKYDRAQLLESIVMPSKKIEASFQTYRAVTLDGQLHTGLIVSQDENHVSLRTSQNETVRLARPWIDDMGPQPLSLMPEFLLKEMTAQQAADLLQFLSQQRNEN